MWITRLNVFIGNKQYGDLRLAGFAQILHLCDKVVNSEFAAH